MNHPSRLDLIDFLDGDLDGTMVDTIEEHLGTCSACRSQIGDARPTASPSIPHAAPSPRQQRRLSAVAAPATQQIWRITWNLTSLMCIVGSSTGLSIEARLVTDENLPGASTEVDALLLDKPIKVSVLDAQTSVPLAAFDRHVGRVTGELAPPAVITEMADLDEWLSTTLRPWASEAESMAAEDLVEDVAVLAAAHWTTTQRAQPNLDITTMVDLGITPPRALALRRNALPAPDEYDVLRVVGADLTDLLATPAPIRALLDDPGSKDAILARAVEGNLDEGALRRELAGRLREPVAARTVTNATSLRQRLEDLLNE